jgi:hypothetical protein
MGIRRPQINMEAQLEARVAGRLARELVLDPVAARELAELVAPAVAELLIDPAEVLVLAIDQAAAQARAIVLVAAPEPETVRVEAALELVLAQLAVALRTKSVTTAHHPDLVPLLEAEEDLAAAAAETSHEPAAAEAVKAWAVAE